MSAIVDFVEGFFSKSGPLAKAKNFEIRPQQQAVASALAHSLEGGKHLVVEAGTGVGKSFAYLVPAIFYARECEKKAIISTQTINLQEQLIKKDLPLLERVLGALGISFEFAMLKGRSNYLCTRRLNNARGRADILFPDFEKRELERIIKWAKDTEEGSLSDFESKPNPKVWEEVCSEKGLCSPKQCGEGSDFTEAGGASCFFQRARERMKSADLLVVNHALFFALLGDEKKKDGGNSSDNRFLSDKHFVIFDEAHNVEKVAADHLGIRVSRQQVRLLLNRLWNSKTQKGLLGTLSHARLIRGIEETTKKVDDFFDKLKTAGDMIFAKSQSSQSSFSQSSSSSESKSSSRSLTLSRSSFWNSLRIRQANLLEDETSEPLKELGDALIDLCQEVNDKDTALELYEYANRVFEIRKSITTFLTQNEEKHVYWLEKEGRTGSNLSIRAAPFEVSSQLERRLFDRKTSVIMTSATLSVAEGKLFQERFEKGKMQSNERRGLDYFADRLGAKSAERMQVGSPFDYQKQMRIYIARQMPNPISPEFKGALIQRIPYFLNMTKGKAFVLFTNFSLMNEVCKAIRSQLESGGMKVFLQGSKMPRSVLLEHFKMDIDSVLFGTDSFWQGVDICRAPAGALQISTGGWEIDSNSI